MYFTLCSMNKFAFSLKLQVKLQHRLKEYMKNFLKINWNWLCTVIRRGSLDTERDQECRSTEERPYEDTTKAAICKGGLPYCLIQKLEKKFKGHASIYWTLTYKVIRKCNCVCIYIHCLYKYIINYRVWSWWEYN